MKLVKLLIYTKGKDTESQWIHTTASIDYQSKAVSISFDDGVLKMLTASWYLFRIGSTELNI